MAKYPKTTGYWVYTHRTPDNMYYVGVSQQQPSKRFSACEYVSCSLYDYIEQYGWENIEHLIITDNLTKDQAKHWEERLIKLYSELGCLINKIHSGNCTADIKEYNRQRSQQPERKEYMRHYLKKYCKGDKYKEYLNKPDVKEHRYRKHKEYLNKPEWVIYNRVNAYNNHYPDRKLITPAEAKEMYELTGYIPHFIKKDDLIFKK